MNALFTSVPNRSLPIDWLHMLRRRHWQWGRWSKKLKGPRGPKGAACTSSPPCCAAST